MSVFYDSFTDTDGAAPRSEWTTATPAGATNEILSNGLHQVTGSTAPTGPSAKFNVKTDIGDFELRATGTILTAASTYFLITFRGDSYVTNRAVPNNGYIVYLDGSPSLQFFGLVSGTPVGLASVAPLTLSGAVINFRLNVTTSNATSAFKVKVWHPGIGEPDAWSLTASDGTYPTGFVGIGVEDISTATAGISWDDLQLDYPPAVPPMAAYARRTRL